MHSLRPRILVGVTNNQIIFCITVNDHYILVRIGWCCILNIAESGVVMWYKIDFSAILGGFIGLLIMLIVIALFSSPQAIGQLFSFILP